MTTAERAADELADPAQSGVGVSAGLVRFEQIIDVYMIETPGSFVEKRKALLAAFQSRASAGRLTSMILYELGGIPGVAAQQFDADVHSASAF